MSLNLHGKITNGADLPKCLLTLDLPCKLYATTTSMKCLLTPNLPCKSMPQAHQPVDSPS